MEQSPRLSLSYVAPSQAQKHVTVNETFRRLDALVQAAVRSRTETAEPADPDDGDAYVIPPGASGDHWDAFATGDLAAWQDGAWARIAPEEGFRAWVADADEFVVYDGSEWVQISGGGSETAAIFGINTTADATNRLAVKSDAVLFNHDDVTPGSGDCRVFVNKDAADDTASVIFQTAASGRAEFGLAGDDNFHVKVSADGSAWTEALVIDKTTGRSGFGTNTPATRVHVYGTTASTSRLTVERSGSGAGVFGAFGGLFVAANSPADTATINFWTTQTGPVDTKRMEIHNNGGVVIGAPTGGSKGAGTLNATAVYDDNTLLSCYVFDQALDGAIEAAKWDAKTPDRAPQQRRRQIERDGEIVEIVEDSGPVEERLHEPLRKFAARIGGDYDPLTLDGYARHWKEKRHLTAMPNEASFDPEKGMAAGEWIQRLVETAEIQAVLIEKLNERVKALEAARSVRL